MSEIKPNKKIVIDENKLEVLKINDKTDKLTVDHTVFNLPVRVLLCGASGSGKNTQLLNILVSDLFQYNKLFKGDDIYIFCPDPSTDEKMKLLIDYYDIKPNNIYSGENPDLDGLNHVYEGLVEEFKENPKQRPVIIIDDYSSTGKFSSKYNVLTKIFCNSRKYNINVFFLSQFYVHVAPAIRTNANVLIIANCSNKNLQLINDEHNYLKNKSTFNKMFREHTKEKHEFFTINYTNKFNEMYLDKNYHKIDHSKY